MMMHSILGDNLFDEDWADSPLNREFFGKGNFLYGRHAKNLMKTDVRETEDAIEADIDLPGFKKDEIQVHLENGYLTVSAEKHQETNEEKGKYLRQERYSGTMSRSFYVGEDLTAEDIKARYQDGILTISLSKKVPQVIEQRSQIAIEG
ncbi:Hsp20/alpha crystallin family protein [Anaerotignum sp.]